MYLLFVFKIKKQFKKPNSPFLEYNPNILANLTKTNCPKRIRLKKKSSDFNDLSLRF